ncbi:hypothetical protein VTH06DRAFT_6642 [Thermothelomyces fergusii]
MRTGYLSSTVSEYQTSLPAEEERSLESERQTENGLKEATQKRIYPGPCILFPRFPGPVSSNPSSMVIQS